MDAKWYRFDINPEPKVRMTQNNKWTDRARHCLDVQQQIAWMAKEQGVPQFGKQLLGIEMKFFRQGRLSDADNLQKLLLDSLQYAGVFYNDNQIRHIVCDLEYVKSDPFISFTIYPL